MIGSWLLDLDLDAGRAPGRSSAGEARWTIMAAIGEGVPAQVISAELFVRFKSR